MNNAQVRGMRKMAEAMRVRVMPNAGENSRFMDDDCHGNNIEVRTAKEMALVPHDLKCKATLADEPNGKRWGWSDRLGLWVRYE
jgi:hypothetical protein